MNLRKHSMRLEDLDFDALINQMWGSESNLQSFLDSETPRLCLRICGPDAPIPKVKVTFPPIKGEIKNGTPVDLALAAINYRPGSEHTPATVYIPVVVAGNKPKLPQFIASALIRHWEALGGIGEVAFEYSEAADALIKE